MTTRLGRRGRGAEGFTLIELLVVVLIIGILAAMAIPQYFKVVERSRTTEAFNFATALRSAQERYMARNGAYLQTSAGISGLDIVFGASPNFGMRNFTATLGAGTGTPGYNITMTRITAAPAASVAANYGGYTVIYDRIGDNYTLAPANAASDLAP